MIRRIKSDLRTLEVDGRAGAAVDRRVHLLGVYGVRDLVGEFAMIGRCAAGTKLPKNGPCPKCGAGSHDPCPEAYRIAREERDALVEALATIADIAEGSGTLNSFPNIAKIARGALETVKGRA